MAAVLTIKSEEEAWKILESVKAQGINGTLQGTDIRFENWPTLSIYIEKPPISSSISPPLMEAVLELQSELYRSLAELKYGHRDGRRLSDDDRRRFEIAVQVKGGSSSISSGFNDIFNSFVTGAVGKMSPEQLMISVIAIALAAAGTLAYKHYLNVQRDIRYKQIEKEASAELLKGVEALSAQETKRMELMAEILGSAPDHDLVHTGFEGSKDAFIKAVANGSDASIQGQMVTSNDAYELRRGTRRKPHLELVTKEVRVIQLDTSDITRRVVNFRDIATEQDFEAVIEDAVFEEKKRSILVEALDQRTTIWVEMKTKRMDNEYRDIKVISVSKEPPAGLKSA